MRRNCLNFRFIYAIGLIFIIGGCTQRAHETMSKNQTLSQGLKSAAELGKPLCVILTDTTEELSINYLKTLKAEYNTVLEHSIVNVVDASSQEIRFYWKWLTPPSLPLTCIFSPKGDLLDLIPGCSKESFLYIQKAVTDGEMTGFHWPNRFKLAKNKVIPLLNQLFQVSNDLKMGRYNQPRIDSINSILTYSYADYLSLKTAIISNDSVSARRLGKQFLSQQSPDMLELYRDEYIEARKALNPEFTIKNAPTIIAEKEKIVISNAKINSAVPVSLEIRNEGTDTLKIDRIEVGCSCINVVGSDSNIIVPGKSSYIAKFQFKPDTSGEVSRDIYISSNAINKPNFHISVLAYVKP